MQIEQLDWGWWIANITPWSYAGPYATRQEAEESLKYWTDKLEANKRAKA